MAVAAGRGVLVGVRRMEVLLEGGRTWLDVVREGAQRVKHRVGQIPVRVSTFHSLVLHSRYFASIVE